MSSINRVKLLPTPILYYINIDKYTTSNFFFIHNIYIYITDQGPTNMYTIIYREKIYITAQDYLWPNLTKTF